MESTIPKTKNNILNNIEYLKSKTYTNQINNSIIVWRPWRTFVVILLIIFIIMLIASASRYILYKKIPDESETCRQFFTPNSDITGMVFGTIGTVLFGYLYSGMYFQG
jgi:hypothetical protein